MNWLLPEENLDDLFNSIDLQDIDDNNDDTTIGEVEDWKAKLQHLEPPPMDVFTSFPSEFTSSCGVNKLSRVGTVPGLKQSDTKVSKTFQCLSPVSVLESSGASLTSPVKGMRSRRKRPTTVRFKYLHEFELIKPEKLTLVGSGGAKTYYDFEQHAKKKRKISSKVARKCTHCETTETPQWREGPNGPKTLCNACGVRFRSGRLVPEYRPASSPTFIPSVHSNSHRKIIEMRRKESDQFHTSMIHGVISTA